jgi:hypothetical protein
MGTEQTVPANASLDKVGDDAKTRFGFSQWLFVATGDAGDRLVGSSRKSQGGLIEDQL